MIKCLESNGETMNLNENTIVFVDKLKIRKNIMTIGTFIKDQSGNPDSLEFKVAVEFINAKESRILPMPITATNYDEDGNFIGYASFDYELDTIFENKDLNEFTVNVQIYNGKEYVNVLVEGDSFNEVKEENEYACLLENHVIIIRRKKPIKLHRNFIVSFLCSIYRILEFFIGILLIPLFILDGIYVMILGYPRRYLEENYGGSQLKRVLLFAKWRFSAFCRKTWNRATIKRIILNVTASVLSIFSRKKCVLFVSSRRDDLTGNIAYVNEVLQQKDVKILFWLEPGKTKFIKYKSLFSLAYKIAKSGVVVVDDYTPVLNDIWALKKRKQIQLWHACGAFKTFGFSRVGKPGGPNLTNRNHRSYNYAIVSSPEIRRFYAEGFGIDKKNVLSLGVPRTDDFFKENYKNEIRKKIYEKYPMLKGKKVVLFAPTFRGNGVRTAFYPFEKFNVKKILDALGEEYVIIIKHHPFVLENHKIDDSVKNRVLDLSKESEINDLLFVTDLLITDYSSVIFEASLLDIPILFYAFDLEEYIVTRDFYYPFKNFVPGKIVRNMEQIIDAIQRKDYEQEKVIKFKERFFADLDGKASNRVAEFIMDLLK